MAAKSLAYSVALNGGATCMAPRRILLDHAVAEEFIDALGHAICEGPTVAEYHQTDHGGAFAAGREAVGGDAIQPESGDHGPGRWLNPAMADPGWDRPRVVVDCPIDSALARGEHFGPAVAVIVVENETHAWQAHRQFDQHLATAVYGNHSAAMSKLLRRSHATAALTGGEGGQERAGAGGVEIGGLLTINDAVIPSAHPGAVLAGHGPSGWGVTRGGEGLRAMTRPVVVTRTSRWLRPPTAMPSELMQRRLQRFVGWWYR